MSKIFLFLMLFAYVVAIVGGIGYTLLCNAPVIAVAIIILGIMAFPTAKMFMDELTRV